MTFPNANAGVKKIFTSEILSIISTAALLLAALIGVLSLGAAGAASAANSDAAATSALAGFGITAIFGIVGAIIAVIAYILLIVGVSKAMKDEPSFKMSLIFIIVAAACTIIASLVGESTVIGSIIKILGNAANLGVTVFIIQGISNLAAKLNNDAVVAKAQKILIMIVCIYAIIIIANIVALFSAAIAGIITLIAMIASLVQYIIFLTLLANAKKMLAA